MMRKPTKLPNLTRPLWQGVKRVLRVMAEIVFVAVVFTALIVLVLETISGCGESYVDSKGVTHRNECLFINR
jgi:hypothetical protein